MNSNSRNQSFAHSIAFQNGPEFALPSIERVEIRNQSDYYGASSQFLSHAGRSAKSWKLDWLWQHGWIPRFSLVDPLVITSTIKGLEQDKPWFVSVAEEKEFFLKNGFEKVESVGLPILYANTPEVPRIGGSLLVMPIHSSPWAELPQRFREFVGMVHELKPYYSKIVFCLHESCLDNGLWVNELREFDIPFVLGASVSDRNSLVRSSLLFKQFETVLTNGFGSHLPYASAFGAKLSIFGDYPKIDPNSLQNEPFYKKFPHLLKTYLPLCSEENIREKLNFLFCEPRDAKMHVEWGRQQIGWQNKLSKKSARQLLTRRREFVFDPAELKRKTKSYTWKGIQLLPEPVENKVSSFLSKAYRDERKNHEQMEALKTSERFVPGTVKIDGRSWNYADAQSFYHAYQAIYRQRCFDLRLDLVDPRIIDAGAHVGMASRFWKEEFPNADIVAIEADGDLIPLIEKNLDGLPEPKPAVLHAALWTDSKGVEFEVQGADAGHILAGKPAKGFHLRVPSIALIEVVGDKKVDFLKMDIEGAEGEVLRAGKSGLRWVDRIFVEYHSWPDQPQSLAEILSILRDAGFRVWMNSEYSPRRPFVSRPTSHGMDLQLNISGIKEDLL
ncbi:FkbM family methyltransferase [Puniceicoccus vermicola]|uniref:FkbM family methyltransferase n=1 Tax=Puniceicoccus vermicola TaxID=388746 RepID=A0A7X1AWA7_9BACT|nr:FkbM family methyltransferase [Puniceicoccus vermicola]MBC2601079.1 FkbM family methyltransferase [Puniceicoccus vermicola]